MKRIITSAIIMALILCCYCTIAFADNETTAEMSVEYTVGGTYNISIPSTLSLNTDSSISFYASNVNILNNKKLIVTLDKMRLPEHNGCLQLSNTSGYGTLDCDMVVGENGRSNTYSVEDTMYIVAVFGNGDDAPIRYGRLDFTPNTSGVPTGKYSCTMYFTIEVGDFVDFLGS